MRKLIIGFLSALMLNAPLNASATTVPYKSFDNLINEAEGIVVGTVRSVEPRYTRDREIYTYVTLDLLTVLRGDVAGPPLILRLKGGQVGNDILNIQGSPQFRPNERVVLFVQGNGRFMVPLVGWSQGVFRLVNDPVTRREIVEDADGNPVLGIQKSDVLKIQIHKPQAHILLPGDAGTAPSKAQIGTRRTERAEVQAGGGLAEDGSLAVSGGQKSAPSAKPMSAESFLSILRSRIANKPARGVVRSVTSGEENFPDGKDASFGKTPPSSVRGVGSNAPVLPRPSQALPNPAKQ